jgi:hypothetical protein
MLYVPEHRNVGGFHTNPPQGIIILNAYLQGLRECFNHQVNMLQVKDLEDRHQSSFDPCR